VDRSDGAACAYCQSILHRIYCDDCDDFILEGHSIGCSRARDEAIHLPDHEHHRLRPDQRPRDPHERIYQDAIYAGDCTRCGMLLRRVQCDPCNAVVTVGHAYFCQERLARDVRECPQATQTPSEPARLLKFSCGWCHQPMRAAYCRRCDAFFWNGHVPTCAVPAMFPALERHFQGCVLCPDFDLDEVIC
jgi:hypothetical protein